MGYRRRSGASPVRDSSGSRAGARLLPRFVGGTSARLASGVSLSLGRGAIAAALALLLTAALAALARASHAAPTGVTVTPGASQLTVTWTASSGADGYLVQWKSGTENWDSTTRQRSVNSGSTVTDTISSLTPTTVYTVRVGATKGAENPAWSTTATGAPLFGCKDSTAVDGQSPVTGANNDLIDDCENLLAAKAVLDPGGTQLNWATNLKMETTPGVDGWTGIRLHSDRVNHVALANKSLTGRIPSELGNLTYARYLGLAANSLTGGIPAALSGMTELKTLSLEGNSLSGPIPPALGDLANLTGLHLQDNQLTGTIPAGEDANRENPTGLAKFAKLQTLSLGTNSLTGQIPAALGHISTLKWLRLNDNDLTGSIPAGTDGQNLTGLARLEDLESLQLRRNDLTGSIPAALGQLTKLTRLALHENDLTGSIPAALGDLTNLEYLHLHENRLTGQIPPQLGNLRTLQVLWLDGNRLTGPIPTQLGNSTLTELRDISLNDNQLTGPIPSELGSLSALQSLWLHRNRLTGPIPTQLGSLTALRSLLLMDNQLTGSIPSELGSLSELQYLRLHRNRLTGPIPTELGNLTKLLWLYLNCNDLTGTVPTELGGITTLARLGINGNPRLDPTLPPSLSQVATPTVTCTAVTDPTTPPSRPGTSPAPRPAPAPKRPRLAAALTAAPAPVRVGESVTFTLTVTNPGTVPLSGVFWRSPVLGVARRAVGDGALAVGAVAETTFSFGPVTEAHQPGPIVVNVFADSDQTDEAQAALAVAVQPAAPTPTPPSGATEPTAAPEPAPTAAPAAADPRPAVSDLDLVVVRAFYSAPDPPDPHLGHNILALQLTLPDGTAVACDFLAHYLTTGGLARWGYATSEILEEREGALTQYYQRGAVDCHFRAGQWRVERRLTWDFIGGGVFGAPDQGVEPDLLSDQPGVRAGPWGHRVSNFAVDGTYTGFLDFFHRHGGVPAFGYPKTEARRDDDPAAVLLLPEATPGFIRQYFQAAVFEHHPGDPADPVKLGLAGDVLRDLRYPNGSWQRFASFRPAPILTSGEGYVAERVVWNEPAG